MWGLGLEWNLEGLGLIPFQDSQGLNFRPWKIEFNLKFIFFFFLKETFPRIFSSNEASSPLKLNLSRNEILFYWRNSFPIPSLVVSKSWYEFSPILSSPSIKILARIKSKRSILFVLSALCNLNSLRVIFAALFRAARPSTSQRGVDKARIH